MTDQQSVLHALRASVDDLARELDRLSVEAAAWRPGENEWSQLECLKHLQITERHILLARLRAMAAQDNPLLPVIDEKDLMEKSSGQSRDELLADFRAARREEVALLETHDWSRPGVHETRGPISMGWTAHYTLSHTWEHLSQMMRARLSYETRKK
jgi:DinB superfamily